MPIATVSSGQTIDHAYFNAAFALCVLTDTAKTITVTHTFSVGQTFTTGAAFGGVHDPSYTVRAYGSCRVDGIFTSGATSGAVLVALLATTGNLYQEFENTSGKLTFGIESSAGATIFPGTSAYSAVVGTAEARSLHLCTNNAVAVTIASGGATTFAAAVTVTTGGLTVTAGGLTATAAAGTAPANSVNYGGTTQSTVGAAGGASALPATPTGYIIVNVAGTNRVIPYYAAS